MAQKRLSMRKIKEVLRLTWAYGLPKRAVAASCLISTSVSNYVRRAKVAGLSWPLPDDLDEAAPRIRLFSLHPHSINPFSSASRAST